MPAEPSSTRRSAWLALPAAVSLVVFLASTGRRAPWGDEAFTVYASTLDWPDFVHMVTQRVDAVHATYYLLMRNHILVFGHDPAVLRIPSAIAMALACLAVTLIAARLCGRRCGLVAGFAFVALPVTIDYATEARSIALGTCLAAWSTWVALRIADSDRRPWWGWAGYVLLLTLTGWVFLYAWLVVVVHAVVLATARDRSRRLVLQGLAAVVTSVVLMVPLLVAAASQRHQVAWIGAFDDPATQAKTFAAFVVGNSTTLTRVTALALWIVVLWGTVTALRSARTPGARRALAVGWTWFLGPGFVLLAVSVVQSTFSTRYIVFCAPGAAVLLAVSLDRLRTRWLAVAGTGLLVLAIATHLTTYSVAGRDDWQTKADVLTENAEAGDAIVGSWAGYALMWRVWPLPTPLVDLSTSGDRIGSDYLPAPETVPIESAPDTVWLVPRVCPNPQDQAYLTSHGYRLAAQFPAGDCPVEKYVKAQASE
jgi:mannosyltransferase